MSIMSLDLVMNFGNEKSSEHNFQMSRIKIGILDFITNHLFEKKNIESEDILLEIMQF